MLLLILFEYRKRFFIFSTFPRQMAFLKPWTRWVPTRAWLMSTKCWFSFCGSPSVKEEQDEGIVCTHTKGKCCILPEASTSLGWHTDHLFSPTVSPSSYIKNSVCSSSKENKNNPTQSSQHGTEIKGRKQNNMNLRLMNSSLDRLAQNSFV